MPFQKTYQSHFYTITILIFTILTQIAQAKDVEFYGSLRLQAEAVRPDDNAMEDYNGLRDAYSRLGIKVQHKINETGTIYAKFEIPLDLPNKKIQGAWNHDEEFRIAELGLKGTYGDIRIGKAWIPYYNAIAAPVDMFSSYYSGFASYSSLRLNDSLIYSSPEINGFSAAFAISKKNGALKTNGKHANRNQITMTYKQNNLQLSLGYDNLGGQQQIKLWGASATWQATPKLYIAFKYETHKSNISQGYGADNDKAINLYTGYSKGKNTFKAMLAKVDNYGDNVFHLGWDYQYRKDLRFFTEYYYEESSAVITEKLEDGSQTCWSCNGGYVFLIGVRYDFNLN